MTFDEFMAKMLEAFPEATVEEDNEGQLVIYTNLIMNGDRVIQFTEGVDMDETLECYACGGFDGVTAPERKVVKLGAVVNRADPTQTYILECGHVTT